MGDGPSGWGPALDADAAQCAGCVHWTGIDAAAIAGTWCEARAEHAYPCPQRLEIPQPDPALADTKPAPRPSACRQCGGSRRIRVPVSRVASVVVVCGECAG